MLKLGIIGCGSVMQGPYMELVNKLVFKKILEQKFNVSVDEAKLATTLRGYSR